jgi:restriction system protein
VARASRAARRRLEGVLLAALVAAALILAYAEAVAAAAARLWPAALAALAATGLAVLLSWRLRRAWVRLRARRAVRRTGLEGVDAMNGQEFEEFVAELMRRDGFTAVEVVGRAGDGGVDIRARTPQGRHLAVQCKRLKRPAQPRDVRELLGVLATTHRDHAGMLVSANGFTERAREQAADHLTLVGREELARWVTRGTPPQLPPR